MQIRPLLGKELLQSDEVCLQVVDQDQVVLGRDRIFRFDGVFRQDSTQVCVHRVIWEVLQVQLYHDNGGHIGGQLSIGVIQFVRPYHGFLLKK